MGRKERRVLLYGSALVVLGTLVWAGFVREVPPDASTRLSGARMIAGLGDYDTALEICDLVRKEHPEDFDARVCRASFLSMAGRYEESLEAFDDAIANAPAEFESTRLDLIQDRASVLLALERFDEFDAARAELERTGGGHRVYVMDGLRAEASSEWSAAVVAFGRAVELAPEEAFLKVRLANAHLRSGDAALEADSPEKAVASYDAARAVLPTRVLGYLRAADARHRMGQPRVVLELLREAAKISPAAVRRFLDKGGDGWDAARADETLAPLLADA